MALLVLVCGCKKNEELPPNNGEQQDQEIMVSASIVNALEGTKTAWASGDSFSLFSDKSATGTTLSTTGSGVKATFTGNSIDGDNLYALWPVIGGTSFEGTSVSFEMPATQQYVAGMKMPSVFPMAGKGTVKDGINFQPVCAILEVGIDGSLVIS